MTNTILCIGIDVSKRKLDVAALFSDRRSESSVFENTTEGIESLIQFLKTQKVAKATPCVIESTGDYHLLVSIMLAREDFTVNCINPLITKKYQRASIRNAKNDPIDAKRLAEIGITEPALPRFTAQTKELFVKRVISFVGVLEKTRQQLRASLYHIREVEAILHLTAPLEETEQALLSLTKQIDELESFIAAQVERGKTLAETRGVSEEKAAQLLGMLGTNAFTSRDALVAFVGLDVMPRASGMWQGKQKLSKRGDPFLRKLLYRMAWGLKMHNDIYREYYEKLRKAGKHYTTCLIAVARKFLRFVYATFFKVASYPQVVA